MEKHDKYKRDDYYKKLKTSLIRFNVWACDWSQWFSWHDESLTSDESSFSRLRHQFVIIVQFVLNFIINLKTDEGKQIAH